MTQLVDDQILGDLLRGADPPRPREVVCTTGYWYYRLCQAVLGASARAGVLSHPFAGSAPAIRERAVRRLGELPDDIGLVSLRDLAPQMADLRRRHRLNVLGIEVLAAAVHLEAAVYLSVPSPRLEDALRAEGFQVEVVG